MLDRIHWKEPKDKSARTLRSKINVTIDLTPVKPGEGRTSFEQAMRTIFPGGWSRGDAQHIAMQAIKAVSEAIVADGDATFPLEVAMLRGNARRSGDREAHIISVNFRADTAA